MRDRVTTVRGNVRKGVGLHFILKERNAGLRYVLIPSESWPVG